MRIKYPIYLLFAMVLSALGPNALAQKLTASAPPQVTVGQQFEVRWSLNTSGSDFIAPEITDFQVLGGPNQSTSMQYVNGHMSRSVSYSYVLSAIAGGTFAIKPASIKVNNKVITSNAVTINVIKGSPNTQSNTGRSQQPAIKSSNVKSDGKNIFARVVVSKRKVEIGEKIIADLKIYSRLNISNFEDWKMPSFEGFWTKEVDVGNQVQLQNEVIDGAVYQTGLLKHIILYPQQSGEITIDPMELDVVVRERSSGRGRSMFDQFFGGGYQDRKIHVVSNKVKIKVSPLPAGKPADFCGLSGKLTMKARLDKSKVKANEAVNLKITISGDGNLYQLQPIAIDFPPDIEAFDPKTSDHIKVTKSGISGSRSFEYVLIPRYAGQFSIGPFSFSYYDPSAKRFKTVTRDAFTLEVEKGDGEESAPVAANIANKEDIKMIGSDIRFIKQGQYPILSGTHFFYRSMKFYAALCVPLLLFLLLIGYAEFRKSQGKDLTKLRSKRSTGLAKKRLRTAKKLWDSQQTTAFYEEVFKALSDYAANKFSIPLSSLSKNSIRETLAAKHVPDDAITEFLAVLDKTEYVRFAPGADKQMGNVYDEAMKAIINVESHA